jgi:hypothetical protein
VNVGRGRIENEHIDSEILERRPDVIEIKTEPQKKLKIDESKLKD